MLNLSPLWLSLKIAAMATILACFLGIAAAQWMHAYRGRWRSLLDGLFLAPMVLPPTVLGFLLLLLLGKHGPLGKLLSGLGLNVVFTWYAAVITATVVSFPLMYKTVLGALAQIDDTLQQAARTLGASERTLFWRITLPLALPGIIAGATLAFVRALGEFGATLMLAGNIPGKTQTLPMAIYFAVEAGAFREAAGWTAVVLIITLTGLVVVNGWPVWWGQGMRERGDGETRGRGDGEREVVSLGFPVSGPVYADPASVPSVAPCLSVNLVKALPGFTLEVSFSTDRQPLGLLGASGAGKSLILRCIAGIETPDAGRIVLNGRVLFDSERGINLPSCDRKVGILFQHYALFPHLTVAQNIAFGLPRNLSAQQQQQAVVQHLATVQLQGKGQRLPAELSGGQQQRVALARVLASQPEVLLLDEPFSALDTHLRYRLERDLRLQLNQFPGITLFVSHNIEEAYRVCSRLLVVEQGRISIHDAKSAVLEQPQTVSAAQITGCKNIARAVPAGPRTVYIPDWDCSLQVSAAISAGLTHIGMRAHQFEFLEAVGQRRPGAMEQAAGFLASPLSGPNTFPCWLAMTSETPHRMTLYLKLNAPPSHAQDYHLQAEVFKAKWAVLREMPLPWSIVLPPERLINLSDGPRLSSTHTPCLQAVSSF